jgi:hypothetical protein
LVGSGDFERGVLLGAGEATGVAAVVDLGPGVRLATDGAVGEPGAGPVWIHAAPSSAINAATPADVRNPGFISITHLAWLQVGQAVYRSMNP